MKENDKHYTNISKYAVTEQVYSNTPKCIMEGKNAVETQVHSPEITFSIKSTILRTQEIYIWLATHDK